VFRVYGEKKGREGANKSVGVVISLLYGALVDALAFVWFGAASGVPLTGSEEHRTSRGV
jgi:hypothetical protein